MLEIVQLPVLNDNYVYLVRDSATGRTAVVDPAVSEPVIDALEQRGWRLDVILNTHHHGDHVGGNRDLIARYGATVVGARNDRARIPGITIEVGQGDRYALGDSVAQVFDVPGHTSGHIAYWFADSAALFCGDTLFALGCGRLFEGSAEQMWSSLVQLKALPGDTRVYCAHEYTQSNARFALSVDGDNAALRARSGEIDRLRAAAKPTVPSTIAEENATNPFLRADTPALAAAVGMRGAAPAQVFGEIRKRKDTF